MSLSRAQVQILATTEPFATMLRELIAELTSLIWRINVARQRNRSRLVTRNKQRRNW